MRQSRRFAWKKSRLNQRKNEINNESAQININETNKNDIAGVKISDMTNKLQVADKLNVKVLDKLKTIKGIETESINNSLLKFDGSEKKNVEQVANSISNIEGYKSKDIVNILFGAGIIIMCIISCILYFIVPRNAKMKIKKLRSQSAVACDQESHNRKNKRV